jgi:antitoxin (DNA-binding transcriptional repressor) of toxin-antitoxin stability system
LKSASIRDLRNSFPQVAQWIEEGECVEITRSGKPFARLAPIAAEAKPAGSMPNFLKRLRENFPDETPNPKRDSVLDYDRSDR